MWNRHNGLIVIGEEVGVLTVDYAEHNSAIFVRFITQFVNARNTEKSLHTE